MSVCVSMRECVRESVTVVDSKDMSCLASERA